MLPLSLPAAENVCHPNLISQGLGVSVRPSVSVAGTAGNAPRDLRRSKRDPRKCFCFNLLGSSSSRAYSEPSSDLINPPLKRERDVSAVDSGQSLCFFGCRNRHQMHYFIKNHMKCQSQIRYSLLSLQPDDDLFKLSSLGLTIICITSQSCPACQFAYFPFASACLLPKFFPCPPGSLP